MIRTRRDRAGAALLIAAVLLAYLPALHGGRLLDDDRHITAPALRSLGGLGRIWFEPGATQQYYPAVHTAFWLEHRLWGGAVEGYHLANALEHALAALLLVPLLRRLRLPGAWLAAFVFALHPVMAESVAWIAEQKNTLSTVLALGAALAYLRFDETRRRGDYAAGLALFALALLSKSAVATVPVALLVIAWWRRPRLAWGRDLAPLLPWFGLSAAMALATLALERQLMSGIGGIAPLSFGARIVVAGRAFWFYLGKLAWPAGLTFFYPRWSPDAADLLQLAAPLAAAVLGFALWRWSRRARGPFAAYLCFLALLAPVLGFLNLEWFAFAYVADHLQYQASLAVVIFAAAALAAGAGRLGPALRAATPWLGAAAVAALGFLTWRQSARYADPVGFYRTAAELNPASAAAYDNLGVVLAAMPGRRPEAVAAFETGLRLAPNSAAAHRDLGLAYSKTPGRMDEAIREYEAALRLAPDFAEARNDYGLALAQSGRLEDAVAQFRWALRLKPNLAGAHNNMGLAWLLTGRLNDAVAEFQQALRLDPDFAPGWHALGMAWTQLGDRGKAAAAFREELRLSPGNPQAAQALAAVEAGGS
ncbi:MAG TPA: tetratricopeptide repeat protein [Opitutaceae bacterium]|jgi:tetratricopeptide (TPR) repeat protein|nr:tetratricopeptide repeat protein [Opitutaceae bacterium]